MNLQRYYIDIVGACNLQCPSCPSGRKLPNHSKKMMDIEYFEQVIQKIKINDPNAYIALYNWGEPLLHPHFENIIRICNKYGFKPDISTNLSHNSINNLLNVLDGINSIRISISGYSQSTYCEHHINGNIELVKQNMLKIHDKLLELKLNLF